MAKRIPSVFISHARQDSRFAERLAQALRQRGIEAWGDWDILIPDGSDWTDEILKAIQGAEVVLILVSPEFLSSPSANFEAGVALSNQAPGRHVIPILLRGLTPDELPYPLRRVRAIVAASKDETELVRELIQSLETVLPEIREAERA